ncbi:MAG: YjbQ family protein [Bacteroidaceae bacterium]|nr:YjbQ family protein [Bacteroidaceae bacterium]
MIQQIEFTLSPKSRGCHLITHEVMEHLSKNLPQTGLLNLFVKHTSCALSINENADPDVRRDMDNILNQLIKENEPFYEHTLEGADDMPAHAKCSLMGVSLTIPITSGHLNLGTWQGIYLCEFRNYGGPRRIVATLYE